MTVQTQNSARLSLAALCAFTTLGLVLGFFGGTSVAKMAAPTENKGISVEPLGTVTEESLKAQIGLEGYILQMRAVTIEPGGQVRKHDHAKRPGLVKMLSGEWVEGRPDGERTLSAASDTVLVEHKDTVHWVFNRTSKPATGLVCGISKAKKF